MYIPKVAIAEMNAFEVFDMVDCPDRQSIA
jgi:hypothetical protein